MRRRHGSIPARWLLAAIAAAGVATAGCSRIVVLHDALSAEEHLDLGVAYEHRGELGLAEREYRRALRRDPRLGRAWLNLGNVAAARERWSEAEARYRRATRLLPEDPDSWNNLAMAQLRRGKDLAAAEGAAERAVELAGRSGVATGRDSLYRATREEVRAARASPSRGLK